MRLLVRLHIEEKQMEHPLIRSGFQRNIFVQWNDRQLIPRRDGAGLTDFHVLDHQLDEHALVGAGGVGDLDRGCCVGQGDRDLIGIGDVHRAAALGLGHFSSSPSSVGVRCSSATGEISGSVGVSGARKKSAQTATQMAKSATTVARMR